MLHLKALLGALAIAVLLLVGCGSEGERQAAPEGPQAGEPEYGGLLIVGMPFDVDALNPVISTTGTAHDIEEQLFWPLAQVNPDLLTFRPGLADSWEFSPDSLSITFHLNPKAAWHDGRLVRAEDVVWTIRICKDERVAWSAIRWMDHVRDVTALDSLTVRFDFDRRYPYQLMDATACRPLPKHALEEVDPARLKDHSFSRNPVGSGPFRFKSWIAQQSIEIVANEKFFKGRPYLDGVVWRIIPDWTSLVTQITNGDIDFLVGVQPNFYKQLETDPDLGIHAFPGRQYTYVAWNMRDPLFADREVRRALTMAVNRQEIIDALLHGHGEVLAGPFLKILWAHDTGLRPIPYDPEEAQRLLASAGWEDTNRDGILDKDRRPFRFELRTNVENTLRMDVAVMVQGQLRRLGIDARPRGMEFTTFQGSLQKKEFQAAVSAWKVGIKADLATFWHSQAIADKFNFISYANPQVDSLIDQASAEFDRDRARRLWSRAQQIIATDAGYTFLFHLHEINALHKRFQNVEMNAYAWHYNLPHWYVPKALQKY